MERMDLGEFTEELFEESAWDMGRLSITSDTGMFVKADKELMGRLIRNLVENGFKYGKPDGNVWIDIHQKKEEILLTVRDDGIGIPEEEQEKIWQRFYQVDPSRGEEKGAGLGLSMVKQIARIHGGYMSLESRPGEGSSFTLHLPMV